MSYRAWRMRRRQRQWRRLLSGLPHDVRAFIVMALRAGP